MSRGPDRRRSDPAVRAGGNRDEVLAPRIHGDDRDAGRRVVDRPEGRHVDLLGDERSSGGPTEIVPADRAHEGDARAQPRGRDRLVAALAPVMLLEGAARHRLARGRQSSHPND